MDNEERELESILSALGGTRHVYLVCKTIASGTYWIKQLALVPNGPRRNVTLVTPGMIHSNWSLGRKFEPGDVVYHTGERIGMHWSYIQQELRRMGWRGNISKVLD